jgi:putative transposase
MLSLAKAYRTYSTLLGDSPFTAAGDALCLQGKNLKNGGTFIVIVVVNAHQEDGSLKVTLSPIEKELIDRANARVKLINEKRLKKYRKKLADDPKTPAPHLLKEFGADNPDERASKWQILDSTLLEQMLRAHRDQDGFLIYKAVPAVAAQQIVKEIQEAFNSYFAAREAYKIKPELFTGAPMLPGFLEKNGRATITLTAQALKRKDGKAGSTPSYRFPSINRKTVHKRYDKKTALSGTEKTAFQAFDLDTALAGIRTNAKVPKDADLSEVRLAPMVDGKIKLEAVFAWPLKLAPACFAARIYTQLEQEIEAENQAKIAAGKKVREPNAAAINTRLIKLLENIPFAKLPRIASGDMGVNNIITMAYSTGLPGYVISNRRIENKVRRFDQKIDTLRAQLMAGMPDDWKALLERQKKKEKLTPDEQKAVREGKQAINTDPQLQALYAAKERWLNDALHKISAGIVKELVNHKIEVFVIGLNALWKQACQMGRKQNRRFYNAPHTRLLELLKYKCLAAGILVVTTEESYTSKTSFALDEQLQTFQEKAATSTEPVKDVPTHGECPPAGEETGQAVVLSGKRGTGKRRHFFESPGADAGWQTIHADLNGAYNIIRKIFKHFRHHPGLSSRFLLAWLSPKLGLSRMQLRPKAV